MRHLQFVTAFSLALSALLGCSHPTPLPTKTDDWQTKSPVEEFSGSTSAHIVPEADVFELPPGHQNNAIDLLEKTSCVQLSGSDAAQLLQKNVGARNGYTYFLVRGLSQNREAGGFYCIYFQGKLWVAYGAMGAPHGQMKREPIIVLLNSRPKEIFVTCSFTL